MCTQTKHQDGRLDDMIHIIVTQYKNYDVDPLATGIRLVFLVVLGLCLFLYRLQRKHEDRVLPTWAVLLVLTANAGLAAIHAPLLKPYEIVVCVWASAQRRVPSQQRLVVFVLRQAATCGCVTNCWNDSCRKDAHNWL